MTTELAASPFWATPKNYRESSNGKIIIADLPNIKTGAFTDVSSLVTRASVSYSMDMASQLSFDIVDPLLNMSIRNYFQVGRDIIYESQTLGRVDSSSSDVTNVKQLFEISRVTVSQGNGGSANYSVECYSKAVQQMKRDKKPGTVKGQGTDFIKNAARKYGLLFFGQETTKKQNITKAKGEKESESLWDVMKRLADDAKFVLFEVDGTLIFASEKFLMHKWGIDSRVQPKFKLDPKTNTRVQDGTKQQRWIPLQYPNKTTNEFEYLGTPGIFNLISYPTLSKSDNDPYAGDGDCRVERVSGTQIRPGMTAYVGNIPNMSGFFLITAVSFDELSGEPVTVSFRSPARDEKETVKQIRIGETYRQTFVPFSGEILQPVTTVESAKNATGKAITSASLDGRIIPLPDASDGFRYPRMRYANMTTTYPMLKNKITGGKPDSDSTLDEDSVIFTGNINLYLRPVLASGKEVKTIHSITHVVQFGSEWRAIVLPTIYTQSGQAVEKSESEVIEKYESLGGYAGSARYLAVVRGQTKQKAILNARDYGFLLSFQQSLILDKRFPTYSGVAWTIPNTPGDSTSNWT